LSDQENETINEKEQVGGANPGQTEAAAEPAAGQEDLGPDPLEECRVQLKKTQEELNRQKDLLLRTAAEYDNYRKRTEREKLALYADATSAAVTEFLPVADNLERALAQKDCSADDIRKGIEMVQAQMNAALNKLGVTAMGEVGEAFDPGLHNAVSHVEDESAGENTISQVFQKGYKMEDKVVRHAMVQVAN
jgi:molecular chaperone GrpE